MPLSVIILDDDAVQVEMFSNVLRHRYDRNQVNLSFVKDGTEALAQVEKKQGQLNLIITDISHPGLNGLDLARACRKNYPNVVVLIQTAFGGDEYISEAEKYADYVLQKPYKPHKITEIIDTLLKKSDRPADKP